MRTDRDMTFFEPTKWQPGKTMSQLFTTLMKIIHIEFKLA